MMQSRIGRSVACARGRWTGPLFLAFTLLAAPGAIAAEEDAPPFVPGRVLVKFKPGVDKAKRQEVLTRHAAHETGSIPQIDVHILQLPENANEHAHLAALTARPEVKFAELDYYCAPSLIPNDPYYGSSLNAEWHLPKIGCPAAWDVTTGSSSLIIAILDTGVYGGHQDLATKMVAGWNVWDNNADTSDKTGHGTGVAGVAGASSNNGTGVASVAWGCKIMPVVVANSYGWTTDGALANGLVWAADHGARVVNMSFEGAESSTLTSAAQYLQNKGGVAVKSAGNSGTVDSGPDNPYVLKVSATDQNDLVPSWSVTGNCIDLAAPGVSITTTAYSSSYSYGSGTGTSFSAPVVSAVAALVLSISPTLTAQQVLDILKQSADDLGVPGWDPSYGWGRVNAARAVAMAKSAGGQVPDTSPPTVAFTSPAAGTTVSGVVDVQVNASDNVGVTSVSISVDGVLLASDNTAPYTFYWDSSKVSNGLHLLTATGRDAAGNAASAQTSVTVSNAVSTGDTTAPSIAITSPANGTSISGNVQVKVIATDNVAVTKVNLFVDGVLKATSKSAPFTTTWNARKAAKGAHTLQSRAYDAAGNVGASSVVTVYR